MFSNNNSYYYYYYYSGLGARVARSSANLYLSMRADQMRAPLGLASLPPRFFSPLREICVPLKSTGAPPTVRQYDFSLSLSTWLRSGGISSKQASDDCGGKKRTSSRRWFLRWMRVSERAKFISVHLFDTSISGKHYCWLKKRQDSMEMMMRSVVSSSRRRRRRCSLAEAPATTKSNAN